MLNCGGYLCDYFLGPQLREQGIVQPLLFVCPIPPNNPILKTYFAVFQNEVNVVFVVPNPFTLNNVWVISESSILTKHIHLFFDGFIPILMSPKLVLGDSFDRHHFTVPLAEKHLGSLSFSEQCLKEDSALSFPKGIQVADLEVRTPRRRHVNRALPWHQLLILSLQFNDSVLHKTRFRLQLLILILQFHDSVLQSFHLLDNNVELHFFFAGLWFFLYFYFFFLDFFFVTSLQDLFDRDFRHYVSTLLLDHLQRKDFQVSSKHFLNGDMTLPFFSGFCQNDGSVFPEVIRKDLFKALYRM